MCVYVLACVQSSATNLSENKWRRRVSSSLESTSALYSIVCKCLKQKILVNINYDTCSLIAEAVKKFRKE